MNRRRFLTVAVALGIIGPASVATASATAAQPASAAGTLESWLLSTRKR